MLRRRESSFEFPWSNAGHPPPFVIGADGTVTALDHIRSPVIGVRPRQPRASGQVTLGPGDTVLLYTDGLIERRTSSLEDGLAALTDAAQALHRAPIAQLCQQLVDRLGYAAEDDIAVLAVRIDDQAAAGATALPGCRQVRIPA